MKPIHNISSGKNNLLARFEGIFFYIQLDTFQEED